MARKGQKFNKYTADFRKMIGQEVKNRLYVLFKGFN